VSIIEQLVLRERIDDLGHVRRVLSEQQSDRNGGYDPALAHAIKRLDQTIGFLWNLEYP
jgi:hypothetical protein